MISICQLCEELFLVLRCVIYSPKVGAKAQIATMLRYKITMLLVYMVGLRPCFVACHVLPERIFDGNGQIAY